MHARMKPREGWARVVLALVALLACVSVHGAPLLHDGAAHGSVLEGFDDGAGWQGRWVHSEAEQYTGTAVVGGDGVLMVSGGLPPRTHA
jgi:hypothetical protein